MANRLEVLEAYYKSLPNRVMGLYGDHRPLSNFHEESFIWQDALWPASENAYQAAKTYQRDWGQFCLMSPKGAKQAGKKVTLIDPNWDTNRLVIMKSILEAKFRQCSLARMVLFSTNHKHLEECNWWGDTYWGTCDGKGENNLGKTLMVIRDKFIKGGW